jgi:hypothetical protein
MTLNLEDMKTSFMNSIRTFVYPQQLSHDQSISLLSTGTINQTFYPFSDSISTVGIYINSKTGSPGSIVCTLKIGSEQIGQATISSTVGWNTFAVNRGTIVTIRPGTLSLTATTSAGNDYNIGASTIASYYYGSYGTRQTCFSIGVRDFVERVFPISRMEKDDLPVIVMDVVGRPTVSDKYLNSNYLWYYLDMRAEVYSKYTNELDKIVNGIDRGVNMMRTSFPEVRYITPGAMSEMSYVKPNVYTRSLTWRFQKLISRE